MAIMKAMTFHRKNNFGMSKKHVDESQTTEFTEHQYDFVWKLKNFGSILPMMPNAKSFKSEQFSLNKSNLQCSLKLDIDSHFVTDEISSNLTISITANYNIGVKLLIRVLIVKSSYEHPLFSSEWNTVIVNQQDVTTSFLLPGQERQYNTDGARISDGLREFQDNGTLTFNCIIKEIRESCTAEKSITIPDYKMKMATDMFTSLYRNSELFDVTFIISDEEIQAHTVVLAAICPYFRKMFSSGMKEQRERTVDFSNDSEITPKVLRGLLDYIYGVKSVEELKDIASDLLTLALKFDIADLKTCCEFIVSNEINKTNVASTLLFAHKYDLKILKDKALSISKMHINDLKASKEFEEICQQVDLVKELM